MKRNVPQVDHHFRALDFTITSITNLGSFFVCGYIGAVVSI